MARKVHIDLAELGRQLSRLRRQAHLLQHEAEQGTDRWATWSSIMDQALGLVEHIARIPARDAADLAIKIRATVWFLEATDAVLDAGGMRQLHALVKDARRLARG